MSSQEDLERAESMVAMAAGDRLELAEEPPGVRLATIDGVLTRLDSITARMRGQFEHLRTSNSRRIPDAYFADEQEVENELQKVGAGLRTAMAVGGIFSDPFEIERRVAANLTPTGVWARLSEASRFPRPATRPAILDWSLQPVPWLDDKGSRWPPAATEALAEVRQLVGDEAERVRVRELPFADWVQLGFVERQRTFATRYPKNPGRQILLISGLEVSDESLPANSGPLSELPPDLWLYPHAEIVSGLDQSAAHAVVADKGGPLAGLVSYGQTRGAPSEHRGLGLHQFSLTPRLDIVALLGLRPERPAIRHVLVDDDGLGIVCRQWRSYLIHNGDHGPLEPSVIGADLIIRPDLFDTIEATIGASRVALGLVVRHQQEAGSDDGADVN